MHIRLGDRIFPISYRKRCLKKIIIIGSINMDIVSHVAKLPRPGETVCGKDFTYIPGGKGANQAIAAHRLGGNVQMLGKIGRDAFGKNIMQFFQKEGIPTDGIIVAGDTSTGAAFVAVDSSAENVIFVSGGANHDLSISDVRHVFIEKGDIVSATLETPIQVTKQLFSKAKKAGAITMLNAAPAIVEAETIFHLVDYLVINETELSVFAHTTIPKGIDSVVQSMKKLKRNRMNIITTLGNKGVIASISDEILIVEGHTVNAIDTTAAGDCFVGALVVALQEDRGIKKAIDFANTAAAVSVQRLGASSSLPTRKEVEKFISQQ